MDALSDFANLLWCVLFFCLGVSNGQKPCAEFDAPERVNISSYDEVPWNFSIPYIGSKWNVPCCWDDCDPLFTDPLFKPRFNTRDGKIDRRSVRTKCGRKPYPAHKGIPFNPAGKTGYSGRGLFRRWGPNVYSKFIITMKEKDQVYVLWKRNGSSYYEGWVDDIENEFPKTLSDLFQSALLAEELDEKERKELIQQARKNSKMYYSGAVPHPWNTDNAWMEVFNCVFRCHKNPVLCKAFLKYDREPHEWRPWKDVHTTNELLNVLRLHDSNNVHKFSPKYSAYCSLK